MEGLIPWDDDTEAGSVRYNYLYYSGNLVLVSEERFRTSLSDFSLSHAQTDHIGVRQIYMGGKWRPSVSTAHNSAGAGVLLRGP